MLTAERLAKQYVKTGEQRKRAAVDAVSDVSLRIEPGEFVAIVGRSGSGKSSLLAMLGGISRPSSGRTKVDGKIGFVFQFASLLPSLRVIDNVALPALMQRKEPQSVVYARARMLLEEVGLGKRYDFYPNELSGGEQRRVAIARALINNPDVVLADEPTADLDGQTESEILDLLVRFQQSSNLTLVVVTHNMEIADRADRVIRMREGRVIDEEVHERQAGIVAQQRLYSQVETISTPASLGVGIERFVGKLVLMTIPLIALVWLANFGIAAYEQNVLQQREAAQSALEDLALTGLRAEVKDITLGPRGTYDVVLYLRNTTGSKPIYVMTPAVRGFVQIGNMWSEVPMRAVQSGRTAVQKIDGEQLIHYEFDPSGVKGYAELLPYYMHVRISNDMLVTDSNKPKADLIERNDNYYVYLKPHGADEAAILKKLKFPGAPPVWIPMPPH